MPTNAEDIELGDADDDEDEPADEPELELQQQPVPVLPLSVLHVPLEELALLCAVHASVKPLYIPCLQIVSTRQNVVVMLSLSLSLFLFLSLSLCLAKHMGSSPHIIALTHTGAFLCLMNQLLCTTHSTAHHAYDKPTAGPRYSTQDGLPTKQDSLTHRP